MPFDIGWNVKAPYRWVYPGPETLRECLDIGLFRNFPGRPLLLEGRITLQRVATMERLPKAPAIILPKVSLLVAVGLALGAAIVKNPVVSRRFWSGWNL